MFSFTLHLDVNDLAASTLRKLRACHKYSDPFLYELCTLLVEENSRQNAYIHWNFVNFKSKSGRKDIHYESNLFLIVEIYGKPRLFMRRFCIRKNAWPKQNDYITLPWLHTGVRWFIPNSMFTYLWHNWKPSIFKLSRTISEYWRLYEVSMDDYIKRQEKRRMASYDYQFEGEELPF